MECIIYSRIHILSLPGHHNGCTCVLAPRKLTFRRDDRVPKHHPRNKAIIVRGLRITKNHCELFKVHRTEVKIYIDKCLPCQCPESFGLNLQYLPAAAFGHPDMINRYAAILCHIPAVLEWLFIVEISHGCFVFKGFTLSKIGTQEANSKSKLRR